MLLAIPIPGHVQFALTSDLKLISSQLGGDLLQLLCVPVYIQGRPWHLPAACGLRLLATWYAEQTDGATPHSPEICLPGAGWEIAELDRITLSVHGEDVRLNRAVLERRGEQMLAYHWFQQRGRMFANEFAM